MSYTRFDDQHDGGHLTSLRESLSSAVQAATGEPFPIFQDIADNPLVEAALARMIESSRVRRRFAGHTGAVLSAVYNRDGSRIVSASDDGTVRIWPGNFDALLDLA
jgi:WD40 repeat protein